MACRPVPVHGFLLWCLIDILKGHLFYNDAIYQCRITLHIPNSALFSTYYSGTLILFRRIVLTLSIIYLIVSYTHCCVFSFMYVICMCDFMTCFVRNDEIKLRNWVITAGQHALVAKTSIDPRYPLARGFSYRLAYICSAEKCTQNIDDSCFRRLLHLYTRQTVTVGRYMFKNF